jgi:hypothetical protein
VDIDIDFGNREDILKFIKHVPASIHRDGTIVKHNTGVYVNPIPTNPFTGLSNIDYETAEDLGYMKLDLLNNSIYNLVKDNKHLDDLCSRTPPWEKLKDKEFCAKLVHVGNHYDIIQQHFPDTIDKLAMVLALIRPAKRYLIGKSWKEISQEIWVKPTDNSYYFKRSHSYSYALLVIVHMNLLT